MILVAKKAPIFRMAIPRRTGIMALNASGDSGHVDVVALGNDVRLGFFATVWPGRGHMASFARNRAVDLMAENCIRHESLHNF